MPIQFERSTKTDKVREEDCSDSIHLHSKQKLLLPCIAKYVVVVFVDLGKVKGIHHQYRASAIHSL